MLQSFKETAAQLKWNGRQRYVGNSFASLSPYWSLSNPPFAYSLGVAGRYFNNKGIDSIAKCYDSKWELLPFPIIRKTYAIGPVYRSKWIQILHFLQSYQIPLSIHALDPWRDWLLLKHTGWWTGKANTYYTAFIRSEDITLQCNKRWKLMKTQCWWYSRFCAVWEASFTFKMKIFMWRILVGHFTLGAFLSKHGLERVRCPHCAAYAETMRHAFWTCPYIQRWWNTLFLFPIWDRKPTKLNTTFLLFDSDNKALDWVRKRCISMLLRSIWTLGNKNLFHNKASAPIFSWTFCKARLRLDIDAMPS
ncbi:hypothetical protein KP509_27G004600 [Ceratopteris richardii]|uniref:Reverse transcriptase zinc-binding domain-containing protein n=1 Tax=Ceratopteris richardii TaxID=49495 RepID=A0A8T2RDI8_CERRI|nr:hypothetical protein KP509_27G004600 [Ceratopteris richardii]